MADAIEVVLHRDRREAVSVVERRLVYHHGSRTRLALTVPWVLWDHFTMLSLPERLSWLVWTGLLALALRTWGGGSPLRDGAWEAGAAYGGARG